jgi:hypothetical protein
MLARGRQRAVRREFLRYALGLRRLARSVADGQSLTAQPARREGGNKAFMLGFVCGLFAGLATVVVLAVIGAWRGVRDDWIQCR